MKERDAALAAGIPLRTLQQWRLKVLKREADFHVGPQGIVYTPEGWEKLQKVLALQRCSTPPGVPVPSEIQPGPDAVMARVVRLYNPKGKLVGIRLPDGARAVLKVRTAKNFVPGMTVRCRHGEGAVWELVGRLPRARGRW